MNTQENAKLSFASDYMEGAHPLILQRFVDTNSMATSGYGTDEFCASAREKIREACNAPEAEIHFLIGGTQTNATVIDCLLRPYEGVLSAASGHINVHEAGAIEWGGHKVLELPHTLGKINPKDLETFAASYKNDANKEHMVMPKLLYLSQPTEFGTVYKKKELEEIKRICDTYGLLLYIDGARLAYALASPQNDVFLEDLARLCDVFYVGGTKCGAFFGEAVVIPKAGLIPHFFTMIKQHGALLAKGRLLGLQFDTLFTDHLYEEIGKTALLYAKQIQDALVENGFHLYFRSPSNQIFVILTKEEKEVLEKSVEMSFWETVDEEHCIVRLATSWATTKSNLEALLAILKEHKPE